MEQGFNNQITTQDLTSSVFTNSDSVTANTGYQIRSDNNNNLSLEENEKINNKENIANGQRYHLTRNQGNLSVTQDNSAQISIPQTGNLVYAIRRQNNQFTLTRTPAIMECVFSSGNLRLGATFEVVRNARSRILSVINFNCKLIKIGVLHTNNNRTSGLIDRNYAFQIIKNNIILPQFIVNFPGGGRRISMSQDLENLNFFFNEGDNIGLSYNGTGDSGGNASGNYCEVRLSFDINARRNNFEQPNIP